MRVLSLWFDFVTMRECIGLCCFVMGVSVFEWMSLRGLTVQCEVILVNISCYKSISPILQQMFSHSKIHTAIFCLFFFSNRPFLFSDARRTTHVFGRGDSLVTKRPGPAWQHAPLVEPLRIQRAVPQPRRRNQNRWGTFLTTFFSYLHSFFHSFPHSFFHFLPLSLISFFTFFHSYFNSCSLLKTTRLRIMNSGL